MASKAKSNQHKKISGQPYSLELEKCRHTSGLGLDANQTRFIDENVDAPAIPFVNGLVLALRLANRKSMSYKLVIREVRLIA